MDTTPTIETPKKQEHPCYSLDCLQVPPESAPVKPPAGGRTVALSYVDRPPLGALSDAQLDAHIKSLDAKARAAQSELALARRVRKVRRKVAAAKRLEEEGGAK